MESPRSPSSYLQWFQTALQYLSGFRGDPKRAEAKNRLLEVKRLLESREQTDETREGIKAIEATLESDLSDTDQLNEDMYSVICSPNTDAVARVRELIYKGADLNCRDSHKRTPLMHAASHGKFDIVCLLLAHGADHTLKTEKGETALDLTGDPGVKGLLQAMIAQPVALADLTFWAYSNLSHVNATSLLVYLNKKEIFNLNRVLDMKDEDINGAEDLSIKVKEEFLRLLAQKGKLDRYILKVQVSDKALGEGSFGKVMLGVYNGQEVALKEISSTDTSNLPKLWREIEVHRNLTHHVNIVNFLGYFLEKGRYFIVVERMGLRDLKTYLFTRRGLYNVPAKALMAYQILQGMKFLESVRVVHRDLAARNVLLTLNDKGDEICLKIGDFGLARPDAYTMKPESVVSQKWAAPELNSRDKDPSSKTDVWSFGATFWEILKDGEDPSACKRPEEVDEYFEAMISELSDLAGQPPPKGTRDTRPPAYLEVLRDIFRQTWKKDPVERFTFEALVHYFEILLKVVFFRNRPRVLPFLEASNNAKPPIDPEYGLTAPSDANSGSSA